MTDRTKMTKLFGESIASLVSSAFMHGAAQTFDMSGDGTDSKKMREYFSQDPKMLDAKAIQVDILCRLKTTDSSGYASSVT